MSVEISTLALRPSAFGFRGDKLVRKLGEY